MVTFGAGVGPAIRGLVSHGPTIVYAFSATAEMTLWKCRTKGQIVIPQELREELHIKPKTKLAVYKRGDKLVLTKLRIPPLSEELKALFREIDENYKRKKKPTEKEILEEIQAYRREKRAYLGA
jgi:AbrB family looped-hinge helix DNA binding protein